MLCKRLSSGLANASLLETVTKIVRADGQTGTMMIDDNDDALYL